MPEHIGIVACSTEGAALCYQTISKEGDRIFGRHMHPEVSLHCHPLGEYMKFVEEDNWTGVGELMLSSAEKLAKTGAQFLICPDNTIHQGLSLIFERSPLPWLHIAEEVAGEAIKNGYKKLGLTGTKFLVEGPVYPEKLKEKNIEYDIPEKADREKINDIIFDELVFGIITEKSRDFFMEVVNKFKQRNCDAVVLGCTEIPLIVLPEISPLPVLDSTRILARAALKKSAE